MERKSFPSIGLKDADRGEVTAVIATLGVVDKDNDVVTKGFFPEVSDVRMSAYGHKSWEGALPVGKGVVSVEGDDVIFDGKFFLDTTAGRDTFITIKELGDLQEWSWGFDVLPGAATKGEHEGKQVRFLGPLPTGEPGGVIHEASPVMLGAGIGTRTLAMKDDQNSLSTLWTPYISTSSSGTNTSTTFKQAPAFSDEADGVLGDVRNLILRAKAFGSHSADDERKVGRTLSSANRDRLAALMAALREADIEIEQLLADTDPNKHRDLLVREFMRFERARANL